MRDFLIASGIALFAATSFLPHEAEAQTRCAEYDAVVERLSDKYGESNVWTGVAGGALVELWVNPDSRSWTLFSVQNADDGRLAACLLASGEEYAESQWPIAGREA